MADRELINDAIELLRSSGYSVGALWSMEDVQNNYICTDDEAMEVLDFAVNHDVVTQRIFELIDEEASNLNLKAQDE